MITQIPFSGFYYSIHDSLMDHEIEYYPAGIQDKIFDSINWHELRLEYARIYCDEFAYKFNIDLTFESMASPKYYNFLTDRIFADISESEVLRLFSEVNKNTLENTCKKLFTSRDGYSSFYDADYKNWGDLLSYDHNQLYALLTAYIKNHYEYDNFEDSIAEDILCNGIVSNLIYNHCENKRLFDIANYLMTREERV